MPKKDIIKAKGSELSNDVGSLDWNFIKKQFADGATDQEFEFLSKSAMTVGANPIKKDCYFVKHWNNQANKYDWSIWYSIDFARKKAQQSGICKAIQREFKMSDPENQGKPTATARVYLTGSDIPFEETVRWEEFYPKNANKQKMWDQLPGQMLKKCAEMSVLRMAFPDFFQGIYVPEEMAQADGFEMQTAKEVKKTEEPIQIEEKKGTTSKPKEMPPKEENPEKSPDADPIPEETDPKEKEIDAVIDKFDGEVVQQEITQAMKDFEKYALKEIKHQEQLKEEANNAKESFGTVDEQIMKAWYKALKEQIPAENLFMYLLTEIKNCNSKVHLNNIVTKYGESIKAMDKIDKKRLESEYMKANERL